MEDTEEDISVLKCVQDVLEWHVNFQLFHLASSLSYEYVSVHNLSYFDVQDQ